MTQANALGLMLDGGNVFLTGPPGSGKSYVIEQFVSIMKNRSKTVVLTATTGIAASLFSGVTIHSWMGLGVGDMSQKQLLGDILNNHILIQRFRSVDILIIDEISMLDGESLDLINLILKKARSSELVFGGIQVIFAGDFFQLPPVSKEKINYAFNSRSWSELSFKICYLTVQHRQINDQLYQILSAMREGRLERVHLQALMARQGLEHKDITRLMTHNKEVDEINSQRLSLIKDKEHCYPMVLSGRKLEANRLASMVLAPQFLKLKVGAAVMFVANNFSQGFVNGTQGHVVAFRGGKPIVELEKSKTKIKVQEYTWKYTLNREVIAEISQLPLRLAWAITIHKSQGMSLDEADIDLSRSFAYGMGYVALSRLKSYQGLYLRGLNSRSLQLDKRIYEFDDKLRRASDLLVPSRLVNNYFKGLGELKALINSGVSQEFIKISLGLSTKQLKTYLRMLKPNE
jgi:ATP-dependent exoDNAse (exonuclease V) alpha subunit